MLKLYYTDIELWPDNNDRSLFSDYRIMRLKKLKPDEKRKQSIVAELLLIYAVRENFPEVPLPLKIKCDENGKPALESIPIYFSLSHSGRIVSCAISDEEIGLDVEHGTVCNEKVSKRFFSAEEQAAIKGAPDCDREFRRVWTAKESVLKCFGSGLRHPLSDIYIDNNSALMLESGKCFHIVFHEFEAISLSLCSAVYSSVDSVSFVKAYV